MGRLDWHGHEACPSTARTGGPLSSQPYSQAGARWGAEDSRKQVRARPWAVGGIARAVVRCAPESCAGTSTERGDTQGGHAPLRAHFWLLFSRKKSIPSGARPRRRRKRKNPPAGGETRPNITAPPGGEGPRRTAIQVRRARRAGAGGGWEVREPPGLPAATSARCILCAPGQGGAPARPQPDGETRPSREKRRRKPW